MDGAYDYGAIAAANALSDVYAMGGKPILALNIAAFPNDLPLALLSDILRGAAEKVKEAGAAIAGGHTIQDNEPKVGLAVVGIARHDQLMTKGGALPGDVLILTKPLGSGLIATAGKNDVVDVQHLESAVQWMSALNRAASEAAVQVGAHAATDITGFGLLGHASEMANAGVVTLEFEASSIPLMEGVEQYASQGLFPGGTKANRSAFEASARFDSAKGAFVDEHKKLILYDAQTSGGLLVALPPSSLTAFSTEMAARSASWWKIGSVTERQKDISVRVKS